MKQTGWKLPTMLFLWSLVLGSFSIVHTQSKSTQKENSEQQQQTMNMSENTKETPFACNLAALNPAERKRYQGLVQQFTKSIQEVRELPDGYGFKLPNGPAMIRDVAEFVTYERACCPFFDFEMAVARENGPFWLSLKGREGIKDFIRLEFGVK